MIELVPINLRNRPDWYKEIVYHENKVVLLNAYLMHTSLGYLNFLIDYQFFLYYQVPSLEHNGEVIGESLVLIKYVGSNFEEPSLLPDVRFA